MLSSSIAHLLLTVLSPTVLASPTRGHGHGGFNGHGWGGVLGSKAVFLQTNEADNALVAIPIDPRDGTLYGGVKVATHGSGSNTAVNGTSTPNTPDALGSQAPVTVAGNHILVVNAGSNTLSVFEVSPFSAREPRLVGAPAKLPGDFPNTVAFSPKHQLVCVGFSGAKSGISCLPLRPYGPGEAGPLHDLPLGQSTPPNTQLDILGQVFFSDDEEHIYATVRGSTGFFASIPVSALRGRAVSGAATLSLKGSDFTLFSGISIPGSDNVFVADPSVGARILSLNEETQLASVATTVNVTGQKATCWIAFDKRTRSAYIDDAGQRRVLELDLDTGVVKDELAYEGSAAGSFDLAVGGGYLYVLFAGNGNIAGSVTVFSTGGKTGGLKKVQEFSLAPLGLTPNAVGIAVL